jgi:hypothetical protein
MFDVGNNPSFISFVFVILNLINCLTSGFFICLILEEYINKKIKIKKGMFYLVFFLIFPMSTIIGALLTIIIYISIIIITWIFDIKYNDFFKEWLMDKVKNKFKKKLNIANKINYEGICLKCKYNLCYYRDKDNSYSIKCCLLNINFTEKECPCKGKLFENN